jgi:HAE1 family hydrophobic/amphiphilic exporter-1
VSDLFRQFALTIAIATMFSLLVSFSIVPLLSSRFGRLERLNPKRQARLYMPLKTGLTALPTVFRGC